MQFPGTCRVAARAVLVLALVLCAPLSPAAKSPPAGPRPELVIPRVDRPPVLEDFLEMKPNREVDGRLAKVTNFIQREPSDGAPASQRTEVYLGYDNKNLYIIFVAFDAEPEKVRARLVPREGFGGDDFVQVILDTFHDQRRAYAFHANPFGIQRDALFTEGGGRGGCRGQFDFSFDTLWHSKGKLTDQGYVVWMAIPFKSLRFPARPQQTWGIFVYRNIPRINEQSFWPHCSSRIEGRLNQAATLRGLENISPARNIQFIPYGAFRSFRTLDTRDPDRPFFVRDRADPDAGLDAKFVFKDSLVLDVTANPDFNQVESDQPQITTNQRFEVFFPEKRPFFLENANFFQTPINLLFTRRIADPQFGVRLTGKTGPYAIGALLMDDQSPGKSVPVGDPLHGKRALFAIARVSRDIFQQSNLGAIYTSREFEGSYNRVGGADSRLRLNNHWVALFQGVRSWTRELDGSRLNGTAFDAGVRRSGRQFSYSLEYNDRSPDFRTASGFLRRPDIRRIGQNLGYSFRPEGKRLISWGPGLFFERVYDHEGTRLDWGLSPSFQWEFIGQSNFRIFYNAARERLRPQDFSGLTQNRDFSLPGYGFTFSSSYFSRVSVSGFAGTGKGINFAPPAGREPFLANTRDATFTLTLRPLTPLRIDNSYLFSRLRDRDTGASIFNNNILRSRWNWQFSRELSVRFILQYDATLANPDLTALETTKNINADILITYLVNPWTALFVGYNGNAQNLDVVPTATGARIVRPRRRFINDAKQFFVKFSYLLRF
ncbi:MAG: carbohydrate binding family 9 domain-containing protein [Acidobacteria bacterium]|nr:carbohydrate binding family 9 domain-containing protein [Acidobacteriota bacterium]